jgi:hypothetical protein
MCWVWITSRCKPDKPVQTDDLDHPDPGSRPDPSSVKARADGVEPVNEPITRPDHGELDVEELAPPAAS